MNDFDSYPPNRTGIEPGTFRDLFELAPTPQAVFDWDEILLLANRAFYNRLFPGKKPPTRRKISFRDIVEETAAGNQFLHNLKERQLIRRWEIALRDQENVVFNALLSGRTLDFTGFQAFEISFTDISKQKRLQHAMEEEGLRLSSVVDNLAAGLFLINQEGQLTEINTYLANLLSLTPGDLIQKPYRELFAILISHAPEPEIVQQSLNRAVMEINKRPILSIAIQLEKICQLELAFFPMLDEHGLIAGWGGLVQDVTVLNEQVSSKLELLSILAHDIRTPMASLKGYSGALLANFPSWPDDMVSDFLSAIDRGVDDLVHKVDQTLALTMLETGELSLNPEAIPVRTLIEQSIGRCSSLLDKIEIELDIPLGLPDVRADPSQIQDVLINLLENAVRYHPADKPLLIGARSSGNWVEFSVIDAGPGLPPSIQDRIFEKYAKGGPEGGKSGLGLFISRKIVEAHGGKIWVESPPTSRVTGSAFHFTLPVMPEGISIRSLEFEEVGAGIDTWASGPRVLVVEDDPDAQILLHTILRERGYQVEIAGDGPTALDLLQKTPVDIVLLDWILPGMSGINICRSLRRWSDVPIMMITSKTSQDELARALDAGADDYVTKPFLRSEVLARIRALLRRTKNRPIPVGRDQFSAEGLVIDFEIRQAWLHGNSIVLTPIEYRLLAYLARHRRQVITYDQLIAGVWGPGGVTRNGLYAHISRLRTKIEAHPDNPRFITTQWGVGYVFLPQSR